MKTAYKKNNEKYYKGLLTTSEMVEVDNLLEKLIVELPKVENDLLLKHGNTINYKYYLGEYLNQYIVVNEIYHRERLAFWEQIDDFVSREHPSNRSKQRNYYEYCYLIYNIKKDISLNLSWRQWNDILDRKTIREDNRIFNWLAIKCKDPKFSRNWRLFVKKFNKYLTRNRLKDTSILELNEFYILLDKLYFAVNYQLNDLNMNKVQMKTYYNYSLDIINKYNYEDYIKKIHNEYKEFQE
jgi:hypothetical protein